MAMTKPAGVFMQLLAIPFLVYGCTVGIAEQATGAFVALAVGVLLLYLGRRPAVAKPED